MSERWMPKNLETYWSVIDATPMQFAWQGNPLEIARWEAGNVFQTHDQALIASINIKSLLLNLHYNETSTANSETLKGTFTEYLKKFAEHHADVILQKARERRLSEQYNNAPEETKLPDWCKVGEWIWHPEDMAGGRYLKITEIRGGGVYAKEKEDYDPDYLCFDLVRKYSKQARLRPYNAEEMKALMGKVLERKDGDAFLVTAYTPHLEKDLCAVDIDNMWVTPDDVLKDYTIDNAPAGVLEHLENGEWVE